MARLHNILPSIVLVLLGAWAGAGHSLRVLGSGIVWTTSFVSAGVTTASMLINDYFDFLSGADGHNCPDKPLPSGQVSPDMAVLVAAFLYVAVLMATCFLDGPMLRAILAFSSGLTLLYTPILKNMPLVKNLVVAAIIALAPVAGALASGMVVANLWQMMPCACFIFCAVIYREILMDISDIDGDRAAGVTTLPVLLGQPTALAVACASVLLGTLLVLLLLAASTTPPLQAAGSAIVSASAILAAGSAAAVLPAVSGICVMATTAWLLLKARAIKQQGFAGKTLSDVIGSCLQPIGLTAVVLAFAA